VVKWRLGSWVAVGRLQVRQRNAVNLYLPTSTRLTIIFRLYKLTVLAPQLPSALLL
jgi:hypothetical protein